MLIFQGVLQKDSNPWMWSECHPFLVEAFRTWWIPLFWCLLAGKWFVWTYLDRIWLVGSFSGCGGDAKRSSELFFGGDQIKASKVCPWDWRHRAYLPTWIQYDSVDSFNWNFHVYVWYLLGGGFKYFLFSPLFGEDFHFDYCFSKGLKPPTSIIFRSSHGW